MGMLLGLSGKMGSGKDAFAALLIETALAEGVKARRLAFGDLIKAEVAQACGVSVAFINAHKEHFRPVLQWWGAEFRRGLHGGDYWLRQLEGEILRSDAGLLVLTDVRFPNEYQMVRARGGIMARVRRPQTRRGAVADHASERALDDCAFDHVVRNYGDLTQLQAEVQRFWTERMTQEPV